MNRFFRHQFPAIVWAVAIFIESSISTLAPPPLGVDFSDKIAHFIVFAILGALTIRAFQHSSSTLLNTHAILYGGLAATTYGLLDECHQYFVPGRYADVNDFIADALGVFFVQLIFVLLARLAKKRKFKQRLPAD